MINKRRDRGDGGIDCRGESRYRLRWRVNGQRYSKTFKGSITEARRELRRLLKSADDGAHVPDKLSRDWGNLVRDRKLPQVMFHALRHSHASGLIAAGVDIVTVSRRLGHGSPAITLRVYSHLFNSRSDDAAARAVENAFGS
jgi:integrase